MSTISVTPFLWFDDDAAQAVRDFTAPLIAAAKG